MKNISKSIVLVGLLLVAANARAALKISIAIPSESLVLDDLDARDAFNRPIPKSSTRLQLVELFSRSLNRMIIESLTPTRVRMLTLLNSFWDGIASAWRKTLPSAGASIVSWINQKKSEFKIEKKSVSSSALPTPPRWVSVPAPGNSFSFLIRFVISSTRLLR